MKNYTYNQIIEIAKKNSMFNCKFEADKLREEGNLVGNWEGGEVFRLKGKTKEILYVYINTKKTNFEKFLTDFLK